MRQNNPSYFLLGLFLKGDLYPEIEEAGIIHVSTMEENSKEDSDLEELEGECGAVMKTLVDDIHDALNCDDEAMSRQKSVLEPSSCDLDEFIMTSSRRDAFIVVFDDNPQYDEYE